MPKLKTAVRDATAVAAVLKDRYGFIVKLLTDGQATHEEILQTLTDYQTPELAGENDSLLIYYGGHGFSDESANKAYWLPVDATSTSSRTGAKRLIFIKRPATEMTKTLAPS